MGEREDVVARGDGSEPSTSTSPLEFKVLATDGRARATTLKLPHYECRTPMFMPVGTQGSVKGLTSSNWRKSSVKSSWATRIISGTVPERMF